MKWAFTFVPIVQTTKQKPRQNLLKFQERVVELSGTGRGVEGPCFEQRTRRKALERPLYYLFESELE